MHHKNHHYFNINLFIFMLIIFINKIIIFNHVDYLVYNTLYNIHRYIND